LTIKEGDQIEFKGVAAGGDETYKFQWNFGDGSVSEQQNVTHGFKNQGSFWVRLLVTDGKNNKVVDLALITVENAAPVLSVPETYSCFEKEPVSIEPITFLDPGVRDTHTATILWGDGSQSAGIIEETNGSGTIKSTHVYTQPGTYEVVVEVVDDSGLKGSAKITLTVNVSYEIGDFNGDKIIDLNDVLISLQIAINMSPSERIYVSTDVNKDGKIDILDAIYVLQDIKGSR
jgi:PKD repeat protein